MARKQSSERKRRRNQRRIRNFNLKETTNQKEFYSGKISCIRKNARIRISKGVRGGNKLVHFRKAFFTHQSMHALATALTKSYHWKFTHDNTRGPKHFFINGVWTQQGHARPGIDVTYPAGKAGKANDLDNQRVCDLLQPLALSASSLLRKHRPDLACLVEDIKNPYGLFHLFICPRGLSNMHRDRNDLISFMFLIKSPDDICELELGGTKHAITWQLGDVVIIDSSKIYHGSRLLKGDSDDRLVGLFIIQKSYCRLHGKIIGSSALTVRK